MMGMTKNECAYQQVMDEYSIILLRQTCMSKRLLSESGFCKMALSLR